jgi:anti-sigma regulatory factor (Ser/Thr protein kinase)
MTHLEASHDGDRHRAMLYTTPDEFVDWAVPFVRGGLDAGERVLAVSGPRNSDLLQDRLRSVDGAVEYMESDLWYTTPARTMAAFENYVLEQEGRGRGVRIIGEPTWLDRSPFEQRSWHRYESLLNLTFGGRDVTIGCPYDVGALGAGTVEMLRRTHPYIGSSETQEQNLDFLETAEFLAEYGLDPPRFPAGAVAASEFTSEELGRIRRFVADGARIRGVAFDYLDDLVVAVNEIATNAVLHGGGWGRVAMWSEEEHVVIEIMDRGTTPPHHLAGHRQPDPMGEPESGFGLWLARQLCELVEVRGGPGWVVRLYMRRVRPGTANEGV